MFPTTDSTLYQQAFAAYLRKGTPMEVSFKAAARTAAGETAAQHSTPLYIWHTQGDGKVRPSHAANNGKIFAWANPPVTRHPGEEINCRCWAEPYNGPEEPPLESSFLGSFAIALVVALLIRFPQLALIWRARFIRRRVAETWKLSTQKSAQKWANQLGKGGWTPEKISETIRRGGPHKAVNKKTGAPATRYQLGDRFVVRDDVTGEIVQVSRPNMKAEVFK